VSPWNLAGILRLLNLLDTIATLYALGLGVEEANPLLAPVIAVSPYLFIGVKITAVHVATHVLAAERRTGTLAALAGVYFAVCAVWAALLYPGHSAPVEGPSVSWERKEKENGMVRGIAKKIAEAKARGGGNFLNPGKGVLIVKALKDGTKPEFYAGETFVAELLVEKCEGFSGQLDEKGKEKPAGNAIGSTASYVQQFEEYPDTAFGNTKTFLLALLGETEESLAASAAENAKRYATDPAFKQQLDHFMLKTFSEVKPWDADCEFAKAYETLVDRKTNPARGMRIGYSTYEKKTRESGKILTLPVWESFPQDEAQIRATRAQLDGTEPKKA
jgi:hypothetical protein